MLLFTIVIAVVFVLSQLSDSHILRRLRRIDTTRRIRLGLLSPRDIVAISHKRYGKHDWVHGRRVDALLAENEIALTHWFTANSSHKTARYYISKNGRLYQYLVDDTTGQRFVDFESLERAKYSILNEHYWAVERIVNRKRSIPTFTTHYSWTNSVAI